ncbi:hypothetical protein MMPV_005473 [Pyropia vietnamensis]
MPPERPTDGPVAAATSPPAVVVPLPPAVVVPVVPPPLPVAQADVAVPAAAAAPSDSAAPAGATSATTPSPPVPEEEPEGNATAEACKAAGNEHFKAGRYDLAAAHYTEAIGHDPTNAALFSNRYVRTSPFLILYPFVVAVYDLRSVSTSTAMGLSFGAAAHTKMELYDRAVRDADMAVALNPMWGKGWWRKGTAQLEAGSYAAALATFTAGLDKCPGDGALLKGKRAARARVSAYNAVQGPGAAQAAAAADEVPAVRVTPAASVGSRSTSPRHSGIPVGVAGSWASAGGPGVGLDSIPSTASVGLDSGNVRPPPVAGSSPPTDGVGGGGRAASAAPAGAGTTSASGGSSGDGGAAASGAAAGTGATGATGAASGGTAAAAAGDGDTTKVDASASASTFPGSPEEEVARIKAAANYYVVLHASPDASPAQLKKNYYTLARLLHPDKCNVPGADDAMKEVSLAYDTLSNSLKRTLYDKYMTERKPPPGAGGDGDASAEQTYAEWEARQEPVQLPGWLVWLLSVKGVNWVVTGVVLALLLPLVILVFLIFLILYLLCLPYRLVLQYCFPEKFAQMRADAERHEARREEMEQDVRYAHV